MAENAPDTGRYPMKGICEAWLEKLKLALQKKEREFGQYAREIEMFYDGPPTWMWDQEVKNQDRNNAGWLDKKASMPTFKAQYNKPFEAVALYGPSLFHQYPVVQVQPVRYPELAPQVLGVDLTNPMAEQLLQQQQFAKEQELGIRHSYAAIMQSYLNTVQRVAGKMSHCRDVIEQALVPGLGVAYTKIYQPLGSTVRYPRTEFIDHCNYVKDSDAKRDTEVNYIAVRCTAARNLLAEEYGLDEKELKGHLQSHASQATKKGRSDASSGTPDDSTFDLVTYWEIYSKNGFGDKLSTFSGKGASRKPEGDYSVFGPFCYLVVCEGVPFPLNLPPKALREEEPEQLLERAAWPIPYWTPPLCSWPVTEYAIYRKGGSIWPVPMFKPLIGPIRFVNWCLSFLADKSAAAGTDYLFVLKKAADSIKEQLATGGGPYKWLEIPTDMGGDDVRKLVQTIAAAPFSVDLWTMVREMMELIDRQSGVNELLAGVAGATQIRSAEEASIRQANTSIRPDDMSQKFETFLTETVKKEMLAAQWVLTADDLAPVVGPEAAMVWEQQIATQELERVMGDFQYQIEAGSARKPNIVNKQRLLDAYVNSMGQTMAELAVGGFVGPWNAYHRMLGEVNQMDMSEFMFPPPDPNQPPPPDPEQEKAEAEIAVKGAELEMKREEMGAELQMDQERLALELMGKSAELQMKREEHEMDMRHENRMAKVELSNAKAKSKQDLSIQKEKGKAQVQAAKAKARATPSKNGSKT